MYFSVGLKFCLRALHEVSGKLPLLQGGHYDSEEQNVLWDTSRGLAAFNQG